MRLAFAAIGTIGGLAAAITAAALWHWQVAVVLVGLLVAYYSATQVDVDVRPPQAPPGQPGQEMEAIDEPPLASR